MVVNVIVVLTPGVVNTLIVVVVVKVEVGLDAVEVLVMVEMIVLHELVTLGRQTTLPGNISSTPTPPRATAPLKFFLC